MHFLDSDYYIASMTLIAESFRKPTLTSLNYILSREQFKTILHYSQGQHISFVFYLLVNKIRCTKPLHQDQLKKHFSYNSDFCAQRKMLIQGKFRNEKKIESLFAWMQSGAGDFYIHTQGKRIIYPYHSLLFKCDYFILCAVCMHQLPPTVCSAVNLTGGLGGIIKHLVLFQFTSFAQFSAFFYIH